MVQFDHKPNLWRPSFPVRGVWPLRVVLADYVAISLTPEMCAGKYQGNGPKAASLLNVGLLASFRLVGIAAREEPETKFVLKAITPN